MVEISDIIDGAQKSREVVPNPLSEYKRLAVGGKAIQADVTKAAVAAALQRPQQGHHHHHQQHPLPPPPPPGMFGFNPMLGGGGGGEEFSYPSAPAGMNYFHGMHVTPVNAPFVFPPNQAVVDKSTAPAPGSPAGNGLPLPSPLVHGVKRKSSNDMFVSLMKKQRSSSSTTTNKIDLTGGATINAANKSTTPKDPPGFEAFQRDPSFINSIMEAVVDKSTAPAPGSPAGNGLPLPSPLVHGVKRKSSNDMFVSLMKKQRSSSSTTTNKIDLTGGATINAANKSTTPKDPPGFEAFQRDPSFINSIMEHRMKENGNTDPLLGPLARGIINMSDDEIFKLSNDFENDSTMKTFVTDVIMPLLGMDDHITRSNYSNWQGYAHISSEHLASVAKDFFYARRTSMKAAVQVAFYEMKKNHQKLLQTGGGGGQRNYQSDELAARKIQQLERDSTAMTKKIEEIYENDIADMRNDHKLHIEELKESHKKEVEALKEEMEDMKCSHREFLGHYVEAAAEAVRLAQKPSSIGRSISDL